MCGESGARQAREDTQSISDECSQYWEVVEEGVERHTWAIAVNPEEHCRLRVLIGTLSISTNPSSLTLSRVQPPISRLT
jgi:hypothetical protein